MRDESGDVSTLLRQLGTDESDRAWQSFVDAYGAVLFQVVHHLTRDPEAARECFVYVCEQLVADRFRRLKKYSVDDRATFSTWLRCVVRNLCVDWRRSRAGRRRTFRVIQNLSPFEQRVYQAHLVDRCTVHETTAHLRAEFPEATEEIVAGVVERIYALLSSRQRWLLATRSPRIEARGAPELAGAREVVQEGANPEDELLERERRDHLADSLGQLSGLELRLLKLRFEDDRSLQVCADVLGLGSPQKAHRMLRSILIRLRAMLPD